MFRNCSVATYAMVGAAVLLGLMSGCASPPAKHTGFLSDYSQLEVVDAQRSRFISPELKNYNSFMVDPVEWRLSGGKLSASDRAKIAAHFRQALIKVLKDQGFEMVDDPTSNTARICIAVTNIQNSTWWLKVHPASSLSGAGRGGVSIEAEVIDAVSGKQLAAFVGAGVGSQFTIGNYTTVSDVNNVIDQWASEAAKRLKELRASQ